MRSIRVTQVLVSKKHCNEVSDATFETETKQGDQTDAVACEREEVSNIYSLWEGLQYLEVMDLSHCSLITDVGVSALAHGCGQLHTIHLTGCEHVTDIGVSALAHGCGQLHTIDLRGCVIVTDIGVSAFSSLCTVSR